MSQSFFIVVLRRLGSFASAFLDSKSGAFQLEESEIRDRKALERLYLVVVQRIRADRRQDDWQSEALCAVLFATTHGMTIQLKGLRTQVDPH